MLLIGKRIKELRNKYHYTQTKLAEKVGVTKSTIASYENDTRLPSLDVLIKLSKVFKVSVDSILLDRSDVLLDAHGLKMEQLQIVEYLIMHFRNSNMMEDMKSDSE